MVDVTFCFEAEKRYSEYYVSMSASFLTRRDVGSPLLATATKRLYVNDRLICGECGGFEVCEEMGYLVFMEEGEVWALGFWDLRRLEEFIAVFFALNIV